jgi:hypothetical protein
VKLEGNNCLTAIYSRAGEAYILIANLTPEEAKVRCNIFPSKLPCPMSAVTSAEIITSHSATTPLNVRTLVTSGATVTIPADDVVLLHIK